jgi:hypothetical protein
MSKSKIANNIKANQLKAAEGRHSFNVSYLKVNVKYPFLSDAQPIPLKRLVDLVEGEKCGLK